MIVDSSALVAILLKEPGHEQLREKLAAEPSAAIGTPTIAESGIVLTARIGTNAAGIIALALREFEIHSIPFGEDHWRRALEAYARFGKGRHPAALNFGDCLAYAVASVSGQPLLYRGVDFAKTDLPPL